MDYARLAGELVRGLRGRRSQAHLSRRLGYRSNALHTWEAGTAHPPAWKLFVMAKRVGVDVPAGLTRFFRDVPAALVTTPLTTPTGITALLHELKGRTKIGDLASASGISRFSLSRWLGGKAQPNLPDLLCFVDHACLRLPDFVAILIDPARLPAVAGPWVQLQRARALGYERPETHAVLRALETSMYRADPTSATVAALTGIPEVQVNDDLQRLADSGQIRRVGTVFVPEPSQTVDFRRERMEAQRVKAHWARVAAARTEQARPGLFAYNVFSISREDLERLIALQRAYLREMRTIIAASTPNEVVALGNFQLFSLQELGSQAPPPGLPDNAPDVPTDS